MVLVKELGLPLPTAAKFSSALSILGTGVTVAFLLTVFIYSSGKSPKTEWLDLGKSLLS